jgi:hypothetical protein
MSGDVTIRAAENFSYGRRAFGKGETLSLDDPDVRAILNKRPDLLRVMWRERVGTPYSGATTCNVRRDRSAEPIA